MKLFQLACRVALAAGLLVVAGSFTSITRAAEEWGDLEGQFVLDGDIPPVEMADNMKEAICAPKIPLQNLVVNQKNKGIRYVFVFPAPSKKPSKVHPDLKASKEKEIVVDQEKCFFKPHALFVRTDQTLRFINSDKFNHNTRTVPIKNNSDNVIITANDKTMGLAVKFPAGAETVPMQVKCDIHGWMSAWCLVLDHPYGAISDEDGKFKIEKLPVGDYEFRVWHEKPGYIEKAFKFTIKSGKNELPPIKVPVDKLK